MRRPSSISGMGLPRRRGPLKVSSRPIRKSLTDRTSTLRMAGPLARSRLAAGEYLPKERAMLTPTMKRKKGKTRSVGVRPFQAACSKGTKHRSPTPLLTIIMPTIVRPRSTSRERRRWFTEMEGWFYGLVMFWGNPEEFLSFVVTNLTNLLNAEEVKAGGICPENCTNAVTESPISRAQNGGRLLRPTAEHSRSPRRRSLASRWAG